MMTSRSVTHMLISWILMLFLFLFEFRGVMEFNTCNFGRENSNSQILSPISPEKSQLNFRARNSKHCFAGFARNVVKRDFLKYFQPQ